jgi:NAD(P)-dependent dehydrogenase (short-subunit alcohol dehydrogenase family)
MIVLLTGASGNLGPAVRAAFEHSGDTVVGVARHGDIPADLTDAKAASRVVDEVVRRHGRLDILAHVLGGFEGGTPVEGTSDEIWRRMLDINLNAAFYTMRAALPHLRAAGKGRIIAVGSRAGVLPVAGLSAYNVSKAGLNALVQTLALELKDSGVTANAVLPSLIDRENGVAPEAIADVMVWLASDAAADVNGALIPIYGKA